MLNIGVAGLGVMGLTHLAVYKRTPGARVVAVCDRHLGEPDARIGASGNIPGLGAAEVDLSALRQYTQLEALLADQDVQAVDLCLPTPLHHTAGLAAIAAGKHVLIEKPLARNSAQARELAQAARQAGVVLMPGHCMRFWPGWSWLKAVVDETRYGALRSARFARYGARPDGAFYADADACGGAHLDLHLHDSDFVLHLFGPPRWVHSFGQPAPDGANNQTLTRYQYDDDRLIVAEGGWMRAAERPFELRYLVEFERATADYRFGRTPTLLVYHHGGGTETVALPLGLGYAPELAEFVRCATLGQVSPVVSASDGVEALRLVEAELQSLRTGKCVAFGASRSARVESLAQP